MNRGADPGREVAQRPRGGRAPAVRAEVRHLRAHRTQRIGGRTVTRVSTLDESGTLLRPLIRRNTKLLHLRRGLPTWHVVLQVFGGGDIAPPPLAVSPDSQHAHPYERGQNEPTE